MVEYQKDTFSNILHGLFMTKCNSIILFVYVILFFISPPAYALQTPQFKFESISGGNGIEPGSLNAPSGISVSLSGNIYVADTGNNRVQYFSSEGELLRFAGGFGWNETQFDEPVSIWAQDALHVYVADKNNHRILLYDSNLNVIFESLLSGEFDENVEVQYPVSVARSRQGDLFIVEGENNRILKFSAIGNFEGAFGGFNDLGRPLIDPVKIIISENDIVYISDAGLNEIVVYDIFGNYNFSIGTHQIENPAGFAIDEQGFIYVCETNKAVVSVFDTQGRSAGQIQHPELHTPIDAAYSNNKIHILDYLSGQIIRFGVVYQ